MSKHHKEEEEEDTEEEEEETEEEEEATDLSFRDETTPSPSEVFTILASAWNNIDDKYVSHVRNTKAGTAANYERVVQIGTRLKRKGWYEECLEAIYEIQHGRCQFFAHNDRGWKPSFDFLFERGKLAKILEGAYDGDARGDDTSGIEEAFE